MAEEFKTIAGKCPICGGTLYAVIEKSWLLGEHVKYYECDNCGIIYPSEIEKLLTYEALGWKDLYDSLVKEIKERSIRKKR